MGPFGITLAVALCGQGYQRREEALVHLKHALVVVLRVSQKYAEIRCSMKPFQTYSHYKYVCNLAIQVISLNNCWLLGNPGSRWYGSHRRSIGRGQGCCASKLCRRLPAMDSLWKTRCLDMVLLDPFGDLMSRDNFIIRLGRLEDMAWYGMIWLRCISCRLICQKGQIVWDCLRYRYDLKWSHWGTSLGCDLSILKSTACDNSNVKVDIHSKVCEEAVIHGGTLVMVL